MPRAATGPRTIDATGTFYAVKTFKGKRRYISLGTKSKPEAWKLWPAAMAKLEELYGPHAHLAKDERGNPYRVGQLVSIQEWDNSGKLAKPTQVRIEDLVSDAYLLPPEEEEGMTWDEAIEIAAARRLRRTGRPVSESWREAIRQALRYTAARPEQLTPKEVRLFIQRQEELGMAPTTIAQRSAVLSGVIQALIRTGTCPDMLNPFDRVDTAAVSTKHHSTAQPEDYRALTSLMGELPEGDQLVLQLLIFTGCRVSEACEGSLQREGLLDLTAESGFIAKNKTSARLLPLPQHLVASVEEKNSRPSPGSFRRRLNRLGLNNITPHSLRHGFKTAARLAGADELVIERYLGHAAGSRMSLVYGEYPQELLRREAKKVWEVLQSWSSGC